MSAAEPYRPTLHFSPRTGWINDPNGLIFVDGIWHAFYQYHPFSTVWGPMHWGHASSPDLVTWTEHPVALAPDALGTCFSGSAIEAPDGSIKLFYTAHSTGPDGSDHQVQCLAHADCSLTVFDRDDHNPILPNPGLTVFRDPKVFRHEESGRWIMVVTHGQSIGIYASDDLVDWRFESAFGEGHGRHSDGPWECPDLFPMTAPDGRRCWVLLVGIGGGAYAAGSGTQYFIGSFDGHEFVNANPPSVELWLDHGRDFYAAQSFFGSPGDAPIVLAWASNWLYARHTPTTAFRGALTLPRQLRLVGSGDSLRLAACVPDAVVAVFDHFDLADAPIVPRTGTYRLSGTVRLSREGSATLALFGEAPQFELRRSVAGDTTLRVRRPAVDGMPHFAHDYTIELGEIREVEIDVYVDNGIVELSLSGGRVWVSNLHFPARPAGQIQLEHFERSEFRFA